MRLEIFLEHQDPELRDQVFFGMMDHIREVLAGNEEVDSDFFGALELRQEASEGKFLKITPRIEWVILATAGVYEREHRTKDGKPYIAYKLQEAEKRAYTTEQDVIGWFMHDIPLIDVWDIWIKWQKKQWRIPPTHRELIEKEQLPLWLEAAERSGFKINKDKKLINGQLALTLIRGKIEDFGYFWLELRELLNPKQRETMGMVSAPQKPLRSRPITRIFTQ